MVDQSHLKRLQTYAAIVGESSSRASAYADRLSLFVANNPRMTRKDRVLIVRILQKIINLEARARINTGQIYFDEQEGKEMLQAKGKWPLNRRPLPADKADKRAKSAATKDDPSDLHIPDLGCSKGVA